ncbi:hypothetical protein JXR93_04945, partial [bacterium]|nr:hypothetical protein [bacterium]
YIKGLKEAEKQIEQAKKETEKEKIEKEKAQAEKETLLKTSIKTLLSVGLTKEKIAQTLNISVETVEKWS